MGINANTRTASTVSLWTPTIFVLAKTVAGTSFGTVSCCVLTITAKRTLGCLANRNSRHGRQHGRLAERFKALALKASGQVINLSRGFESLTFLLKTVTR